MGPDQQMCRRGGTDSALSTVFRVWLETVGGGGGGGAPGTVVQEFVQCCVP